MFAEQLKKSILQAAIQGKLTDQRKEDGSAQDLYNQIQEEKQKLIKEKKIKKEKTLPEITPEEIPFEIPENWVWVRISDLFDVARGGSPRPIKSFLTDDPNGVNWIKIGDTEIGGKYISHVREKIKPEGVKKSRFVRSGDLLLTNSMSYGRPYILKTDGCIHDGWLMLSPILRSLNKEFFYYLSSSQYMKQEFTKAASGAVVKNLNKDKVKAISIPLPPLAEQKRISETVQKYLAEIEQLEKDEEALAELQKAFPGKMKASILQQAIQGKLTDQRKEDGSAQDLYNQIQEEKQRLIKEKKIPKPKTLPEITADEIPFDIPENWMWVRLGDIAQAINGDRGKNYPKRDEYVSSGVAWVNAGHITDDGYLNADKMNYITKNKYNSLRSGKFQEKDLLFCLRGSFGKVARVEPFCQGAIASSLAIIRLFNTALREYVFIYLKSPQAVNELNKYANGTAQPNLAGKDVLKYLIPLPPLAEQKRIVEKLNKLLPLCEA